MASHASGYTSDRRVDLVAGADIGSEALERFGRRWGVTRLYTRCEEMLAAERPQIVSVCTWDAHHGEAIRAAVRSGATAILCEKPLAPTWQEALELHELCHKEQVRLVVGYQRRWERRHREISTFIRSGGLGRILAATGYYVGGVRHNGCAWINLARYLLGEVVEVSALGEAVAADEDTDASAQFRFTGFGGSLHAADRREYSIFEIDILGSLGRITLTNAGYELQQWQVREDARFPGFRSLHPVAGGWGEGEMDAALHRGIGQIVDALEGSIDGAEMENLSHEAVIDMQVVEAVFQSRRQGTPVILGQMKPGGRP